MSGKESLHITALRKQARLSELAKKKLRVAGGAVEVYESASTIDFAAAVAEAEKRERAAAIERRLAENPPVAEAVEGKGIYIGVWEPKGENGQSLGMVFNLFAAPQDLPDEAGERLRVTFNEARWHVVHLENWHGHNGMDFRDDAGLYEALEDGDYEGEWFIPTPDILKDIYNLKHKGDLKGTFATTDNAAYWTCKRDNDYVHTLWFSNGTSSAVSSANQNHIEMSVRPVRLEPVRRAAP